MKSGHFVRSFFCVGLKLQMNTFENLKAGAMIDEFLEWFPGSARRQIEAVLSFVAGEEPRRAA